MSLRIRYVPGPNPGELVSLRTLVGREAINYRVYLDSHTLSYQITELPANTVVAEGKAVSLNQLKKFAKRALAQFGVDFGEEVRRKRIKSA